MPFKFPFYVPTGWKFYEHTPEIKIKKSMWENLKPIELHKIQVVEFPESKIFKEEFAKKQVVLHHTVSGDGVNGDISTWEGMKDSVATAIIINREGVPYQLFSSKYWAYHLAAGNHDLDRHSIGVEIDNWGWLIKGDGSTKKMNGKTIKTIPGKFYAYYGNVVETEIQEYPDGFRGYNYFEKYTNAQIQTAGELILFWHKKYGIPLKYNADLWDVSQNALGGIPGVWSHVSYRPASQKTDCHPQPELVDMLKTLESLV